MIVSQFRVQNRASTKAPPRIYGFYLTNLGDKFYSFRVTLYAEGQDPLNQAFRLDYGEWGDDLWSDVPGIYTGGYMLGAGRHETVVVRLVPIAGAVDADISGHIELSIPVVGEVVDYKWLITKTVRQGEKPVPVLVHAFETSSPNDQGRSITLASGQALNEITPDEEIHLNLMGLTLKLASTDASSSSTAERRRDEAAYIESQSARAAVFSYLARASQSPAYVAAINEQLERSGHAIRLTATRARRKPAAK